MGEMMATLPDTDGRPARSAAARALHRLAEERAAWIDAITDERALDAIVDDELALLERTQRRRASLRAAAATRVAAEADEWIGIEELARLIHRSVSWIRHKDPDDPDAPPGRRQHVAGGRVEWNLAIVKHWLAAHTARP